MLASSSLRALVRHYLNVSRSDNLRRLSTVSLHTRLPTTVYRLQQLPKSNLTAFQNDEHSELDEQVLISDDGLVYPRVSDRVPKTSGPVFMPNTILMQDLMRMALDRYREEDETRKPILISLKKGTPLPTPLVALSFDPSKVSIQSLYPLDLLQLNHILDEFYSREATVFDAEEWFDQNEFDDAAPDTFTE